PLSNFGTITVSNTGSSYGIGIYIVGGGSLTNNAGGTITVSNTGTTYGIYNGYTTLSNSGTITVSNTGYTGIENYGRTLSNSGTITVCGGTTVGPIPTSGNPVTRCNTTVTTHVINDATGQAATGTELTGASFHGTAVVTVAVPFAGSIPSGTVNYHFFN